MVKMTAVNRHFKNIALPIARRMKRITLAFQAEDDIKTVLHTVGGAIIELNVVNVLHARKDPMLLHLLNYFIYVMFYLWSSKHLGVPFDPQPMSICKSLYKKGEYKFKFKF